MFLSYQSQVQDEVTRQVSSWLLETTQGLWGENFLRDGETIEQRLEKENMSIHTLNKGFTLTYALKKGNSEISTLHLNMLKLTKQAIKKDTL